ncbi:MAG: hypothetical protein M3Y65_20100, partial [Pseudomonadota bacterium]|nr:hypothetical protein [Pseudomonadota bacterium]
MDYGAYRIDETNVVPQLARFNAIKVAFERFILEPAPGLLSSFKENFAIRLEQAVFEEPVPDGPNLRIIVEVSLDGKWRQKGSEDPVAIFSGRY